MKYINKNVLSASDRASTNGAQIDADQLYASSFHAYFGDATAAGAFKLQASNDLAPTHYTANTNFTVTNWTDIPTKTATIAAGSSALITLAQGASYRWLRAVYTNTASGVQTVSTISDESAVAQTEDVTCNDDTSVYSVASFTFPALADATGGDYVVFYRWTGQAFAVALNVSGTDPDPTGATWLSVGATQRVNIDISGATTDNDVATLIASVIPTIPQFDGVVSAVIGGTFTITQAYPAPTPSSSVHNANDSGAGSIVAAAPSPQGVIGLNNTYFNLYSANDAAAYYVWFSVDSLGVDPAIPGKIGIMIPITAGDIASNIATTATGPIAAVSGGVPFNANAGGDDLLIYNLQTGPSTPTADGAVPTGFAFAVSTYGTIAGPHLNDNYFFLSSPTVNYYVWYNVAGGGTDPALAGKTGIQVAISAVDSANAVATATAAAIDLLVAFVSTATLNVVTITNAVAGPYTPATDYNTSFTFAVTGGGTSTINVNMMAVSV